MPAARSKILLHSTFFLKLDFQTGVLASVQFYIGFCNPPVNIKLFSPAVKTSIKTKGGGLDLQYSVALCPYDSAIKTSRHKSTGKQNVDFRSSFL